MEGHKRHQHSLAHVPSRIENKEAFNILMVRICTSSPSIALLLTPPGLAQCPFLLLWCTWRPLAAALLHTTGLVHGVLRTALVVGAPFMSGLRHQTSISWVLP